MPERVMVPWWQHPDHMVGRKGGTLLQCQIIPPQFYGLLPWPTSKDWWRRQRKEWEAEQT